MKDMNKKNVIISGEREIKLDQKRKGDEEEREIG